MQIPVLPCNRPEAKAIPKYKRGDVLWKKYEVTDVSGGTYPYRLDSDGSHDWYSERELEFFHVGNLFYETLAMGSDFVIGFICCDNIGDAIDHATEANVRLKRRGFPGKNKKNFCVYERVGCDTTPRLITPDHAEAEEAKAYLLGKGRRAHY
jgi:hypothetical protein